MKNQNQTRDYLYDSEIPALLGLDPEKSTWTLYQIIRRDMDLPPPESEILKFDLDKILERQLLGPPEEITVRKPNNQIIKNGICARPDLTIVKAPKFGPGYGFALIKNVTPKEWRSLWQRGSSGTRISTAEEARIQAIMLASGAQWGVVVPFVDGRLREPLIAPGSEKFQQYLTQSIGEFFESIRTGEEPMPDAGADRKMLELLASGQGMESGRDEDFDQSQNLSESDLLDHANKLKEIIEQRNELLAKMNELSDQRKEHESTLLQYMQNGKGSIRLADYDITVETHRPPANRDESIRIRIDQAPKPR